MTLLREAYASSVGPMSSFATTMRQGSDAILAAIPLIAENYDNAIPHLVCRSPVLFSGMGKSGLIAQKAASTFRSLGIVAHYVHPGDASHGDLGCIHGDAVMVLLSNSGDTPELADMIFFCRRQKVPIIGITGRADSALAKAAEIVLCYGRVTEACPFGLAPTTSTTVALALCDALAVDVARALKITPAVFKQNHPGGKLGARLLTAKEIMREPAPRVNLSSQFPDIITTMTSTVPGLAIVEDQGGQVVGIITDGDIRRAFEQVPAPKVHLLIAADIMTGDFLSVPPDMRVEDVTAFMTHHRITKVVVRSHEGSILGAINLHDTMQGT